MNAVPVRSGGRRARRLRSGPMVVVVAAGTLAMVVGCGATGGPGTPVTAPARSAVPTSAVAPVPPAVPTAAAAPVPAAVPTAAAVLVAAATRSTVTTARAAPASALAALLTLPVKGRAPKTGYSRTAFGPAWADVIGDGCSTRDDILRRDLTGAVVRSGTGGCEVLRGTLADPYGGTRIAFTRGVDTSAQVQIDHVVALSDAWQTGARTWTPTVRERFANDPLELLAVSGRLNEQKSDGDAATWLPPAKAFRCAYVARQVAVKARYRLWVTAPERAAIARILGSCRGMRLPTEAAAAAPAPDAAGRSAPPAPAPTSRPIPTTPAPAPAPAGLDPRFATCREAIAAGYGPYRRGVDPEYAWYRDADHDGIVCER